MNVKTLYKDCQLRNKYCNPLRVNEENVFCDWLESWNGISIKETFTALLYTTYAFLELTMYCIKELKMLYVLPGKFHWSPGGKIWSIPATEWASV